MDLIIQLRSGNAVRVDGFKKVEYQSAAGREEISSDELNKFRISNSVYYFKGQTSVLLKGPDIEYIQIH